MASVITHGLAAVVIGKAFSREKHGPGFWCALVACSLLPDIDVIGFAIGVAYGDFWGHRGFTHSLLFALLTGLVIGLLFYRRDGLGSALFWRYVALFTSVTASHGIFDGMTNGGLGIAFFAPFDNGRYFLPWTPVQVTRVGFYDFFSYKGFRILLSESVFILVPLVMLSLMPRLVARRLRVEDADS